MRQRFVDVNLSNRYGFRFVILLLIIVTGVIGCNTNGSSETETEIKIGVIAPITGSIPVVGQSTINAAKLAVEEVNDAGGLQIGDQQFKITLVIEDNGDQEQAAVDAAQKLINQDNVAAIVGPQASRNAIPAAAVAQNARIPLISPWSTNPDTTDGKDYVFRVAFLDPFQGRVLARFTLEELQFRKAAVLYDEASAYNRGIAEIYKQVLEEAGGSVVAFESYTTGETDFTQQLTAIQESGAEVLFLPNYDSEIFLQANQARELGLDIPLLGSDSWGTVSSNQRTVLEGSYFSTHYAPDIESAAAQTFIKNYQDAYGEIPDDVAALTYDAFGMLFQAITSQEKYTPEAIRNGLSSIERYEGVTGTMQYQGTGDPVKSAVILQIEDGEFKFYKLANP